MEIIRTFDRRTVLSVVMSPDMLETVTDDNVNIDLWEPDVSRNCWLKVTENDEIMGVFQLKPLNHITLECHPYILPNFRGKYGELAGKMFIEWIYTNSPQYQKLVGSIPTIYKNVLIYCMRLGFLKEGLNRKSFLKDGVIHDQWMIGMTRDEMKEQI